MPEVNLKELLEAGAHFGHQTRRWNPKMGQFIYGVRDGVHILDLVQTAEHIKTAVKVVKETTASGGSILFVATKRQARDIVRSAAQEASQPYVVERWLGGMLTNFRTIRAQVSRMKDLQDLLSAEALSETRNKKEIGEMAEEAKKLEHIFGGIADMDKLPAALFVVDAPKEEIAVAEANKLGIPVIALADSNANPDLISFPIASNDDAIKTINVITGVIAAAAAEGLATFQKSEADKSETEGEDA